MTVKRVTAAWYLVCWWYKGAVYHERMFLPEMLVLVPARMRKKVSY
jgi:hypothetical protein